MTTEAQREWQERAETLRNDQRLRQQQQGTTLSQFAQAEAEEVRGRFSGHERATVVGASPAPQYPAAFHQRDPVPDEPALFTGSGAAAVRHGRFLDRGGWGAKNTRARVSFTPSQIHMHFLDWVPSQ